MYYINTFFTKEGISKYYNNSIYPVDVHAPAQMVITLAKLGKFKEHKMDPVAAKYIGTSSKNFSHEIKKLKGQNSVKDGCYFRRKSYKN